MNIFRRLFERFFAHKNQDTPQPVIVAPSVVPAAPTVVPVPVVAETPVIVVPHTSEDKPVIVAAPPAPQPPVIVYVPTPAAEPVEHTDERLPRLTGDQLQWVLEAELNGQFNHLLFDSFGQDFTRYNSYINAYGVGGYYYDPKAIAGAAFTQKN